MRIDLNLYTVFEAIYSEGNLTKAAEKLFITQPAISHSLSKLREAFEDPLFIRQGHKMLPTPLAERIHPEISHALNRLNGTFLATRSFEPKEARVQFKLGLRDVLESTCLPPLLARLEEQAPNVSVISLRHDRQTMEHDLSIGTLDLVVDVAQPVSERLERKHVISESLCVLARKDHPRIKTILDLETYLKEKHVVASYRSAGMTFEDIELNRYGLSRQISLRCQHYFAASRVAMNTDLLLTMPESYGKLLMTEANELSIYRFPLESPPIDIHLFSHKSRDKEPELVWFKETLGDLFY
ncbi:LysR family transcriptional regulator [Litoribrevibacter albus]|uniref:LysR family transcriptional regulator n=1 Tax=Litoribrevibacter albus TaxID=1473156 RepID=A0AA37SC34_9GAMM|nr:LysR family transcriptional regulator [Litoribrevibacter albus]GLQ31803.1 LysR family transcriptional regulator [Litoribrevibacter albus]